MNPKNTSALAYDGSGKVKRDKKDYNVFVAIGDGESQEGMIWEGLGVANKYELDNLIVFIDYNNLQINAFAVVSDSGTLPEESSFFISKGYAFSAVCIRTSTERPEALDKGVFVLAGIDTNSLLQAVETAVELNKNQDHGIPVETYQDQNVSTKVVDRKSVV